MASLASDLLVPGVELIETHLSWIFRFPDVVYKVKKPVVFGSLDLGSPQKRKEACEAEVRLNRRLAPEVYRGVVPITRSYSGEHAIAGKGEQVDWAVAMARLPDEDRADVRVAEGRLDVADVEAIARRIASFHASCPCGPEIGEFGQADVVRANVLENLAQTRATIDSYIDREAASEMERSQLHFLDHNAELFDKRVRGGFVREGHGDLRLDHIYVSDEGVITIVDCAEYDLKYRCADVCADIGFLSMALAATRRVDLAEVLLTAYVDETQDHDLYSLVDFYESYRAWVRARVSSFLVHDPDASTPIRERAAEQARSYYLLALAAQRRSAVPPNLVAVGGLIATGKTTVAHALRRQLGAPVVSTDAIRATLLGLPATEPDLEGPGAYPLDLTDRVNQEVYRRAAAVLRSGRPVILDAPFQSVAVRAAVRAVAAAEDVPFLFVECRCAPETSRRRLRARARLRGVEDGNIEIFNTFAANFEAVEELPDQQSVVLDTDQPLSAFLGALISWLPAWPKALTG